MVNGFQIFNVTEIQAAGFLMRFRKMKGEKDDLSIMTELFNEALDDEGTYNLLLLNAWKAMMDASKEMEALEKEMSS